MPKNLEGVVLPSSLTTTRARFFELTLAGNHQLEDIVEFVSLDVLRTQYPVIYAEIPDTFICFRILNLEALHTRVTIREVGETSYHEGRLKVACDRFKKELKTANLGDPDTERMAYYYLSIGNLPDALNCLKRYPDLSRQLAQVIEAVFPMEDFRKIRQSQGFTVLQLGTLSGISSDHIQYLEDHASCDDPEAVAVKARLLQHLLPRSFR